MKTQKLRALILAIALIPFTLNVAKAARVELDDLASPDQILQEIMENQPELIDLDAEATASKPRLKIYIDKARQFLWTEEDGIVTNKWLVSSGKEVLKCPPNGDCYMADTPDGTFVPFRMEEFYTSKLWDARMDYAIFFNGGIALHATYGENIGLLGTKQSGGCIRQAEEDAKYLFHMVNYYGMKNTRVIVGENIGLHIRSPREQRRICTPKETREIIRGKKINCELAGGLY
ncbi:MAG: L,D-transpeptidase [Oligoflexia bacterium]|nr:L,D-transpeptidase [Oligoflexia bacterium]